MEKTCDGKKQQIDINTQKFSKNHLGNNKTQQKPSTSNTNYDANLRQLSKMMGVFSPIPSDTSLSGFSRCSRLSG